MKKDRIRAGLVALVVLAAAACGPDPTQPDAPKDDVDDRSGKRGVLSAVAGES